MANNPLPYDATVIASVNAVTALLNSGFIKVYTGAQPALNGAVTGTLLATMTFSATAFPTAVASAGTVTATANAITSGTAGNTGTAGYFALVKSDNTTVVATGSVGTSSSDLNLNTLSITSGNTVAAAITAIRERIVFRENLRGRASAILACAPLHLASGHGVRIFAQGSSVSLRQNFHHPPVKIVHRMVHDRFEATVVLSMSFLNVVFQSDANVFVFAA